MPKTVIVVPTYWTWEGGAPPQPGDAVYDHPTPLDQPGTLARLLESLRAIAQPDFAVLVITAATNPRLEGRAEAKVEEIIVKIMRPQVAARSIFRKLGFHEETLLPDWVKDVRGRKQDLILMRCELEDLWGRLEDFIAGGDFQRSR